MKLYKLSLLIITLLLWAACTDDTAKELSGTEAGLPAQISFSITASSNEMMTRGVASDEDEKRVHNLYVLVFDQDGTRTSGQFFDRAELANNQMQLLTESGLKHIYGVANIDLGMTSMSAEKTDVSMLDAVATEEELLQLNSMLAQSTFERGDNFLMTGWIGDAAGDLAYVDVKPGANSVGKIKLSRVDSKISFHVKTATGVTFTPRDWRIVNLPNKVSLFSVDGVDRFTTADDYFTTNWNNFEGEGDQTGKTFAFYLLENKHQYRNPIPTNDEKGPLTAAERYNYREKQEKNQLPEANPSKPGQTVTNGAFVYAPEWGTYVQMRGVLSYKNAAGQDVLAEVTYTVHLGYGKMNADLESDSDPNDYNALRNCYYKYYVTIQSAESIILEVTNNVELQPGAEGTVVMKGQTYSFDAHYGSTLVTFSANMIADNLDWYVQTPFSEGFSADHPKDKDWILFRLNNVYKAGKYYYYVNDKFNNFTGVGKLFKGSTLSEFLIDKNQLLTVDQLLMVLKACKKNLVETEKTDLNVNLFDYTQKIVFTAYVNENYYTENPENTSDNDVDLWKRFVNRPERVLNILSESIYSSDGQSMKTESVISFRQASIQTMYNCELGKDKLQTAWGTELIQDDKEYSFGTHSKTNCTDTRNGLTNTLALWNVSKKPLWNTYINSDNNTLRTNYNQAMYACMSQNRDNNGNGIIDPQEVRWYLAAIDQLTDIWIGESAFDLDARLYKRTSWQEQWFVSSTLVGDSNPRVLWSSEGSSLGNMNDLSDSNRKKLYYRCVRNLGKADNDTSTPEDIASYDESSRTISLDKLSYKAIRSYSTQNELIQHHERSNDNKPYWKFEVQKDYTGKGKKNTELTWDDIANRTNQRICPSGWHVPNQRENALILSRIGYKMDWMNIDYFASSYFSFNPTDGDRYGFAITNAGERIYMLTGKSKGYVKCVRDISQ